MIAAVLGFISDKMRRAKAIATANVTANSTAAAAAAASVEKASSTASQASNSPAKADTPTPTQDPAIVIQDALKELHTLIRETQGERSKVGNMDYIF